MKKISNKKFKKRERDNTNCASLFPHNYSRIPLLTDLLLLLLLFLFYYWIFSLFTFQMFFPFQVSPSETPYPLPLSLASMRCSPTHPLPSSCPGIPLHWGTTQIPHYHSHISTRSKSNPSNCHQEAEAGRS